MEVNKYSNIKNKVINKIPASHSLPQKRNLAYLEYRRTKIFTRKETIINVKRYKGNVKRYKGRSLGTEEAKELTDL